MDLRKGNTVLIHYRRGSDLYQSLLIMQDVDLKPEKVSSEQHKAMWPLSDLTLTGCLRQLHLPFAGRNLDAFAERHYGELKHLEKMDNPRFASMTFQNIYYIGDAKSVRNLKYSWQCLLSDLDLAVEYNALKPCFRWIPINGYAFMLLRSSCGLLFIRFDFVLKRKKHLGMSRVRFSNYKMSMCSLLLAL